jgi:FtsP/CotA-like multicopper oxidase with cupredoxin domain
MSRARFSRRGFLQAAGAMAGSCLLPSTAAVSQQAAVQEALSESAKKADYELTIAAKPIELAPNRIVSVTTHNGQFPGSLLRFKEGQQSYRRDPS